MSTLHSRATSDFATTGRTLEGLAFRWDHPSTVTDDGWRTSYLEAISRGAADRSMRDRGVYPLGYMHPFDANSHGSKSRYAGEALGPVRFRASAEGLAYEAKLSDTTAGNEMLALINDGAIEDVSLSYFALRTTKVPSAKGVVHSRAEIKLRELSLALPGFALHEGSKILAVRALGEAALTPRLDELERRLKLLTPPR